MEKRILHTPLVEMNLVMVTTENSLFKVPPKVTCGVITGPANSSPHKNIFLHKICIEMSIRTFYIRAGKGRHHKCLSVDEQATRVECPRGFCFLSFGLGSWD